ncbi:MAG: hypothetical protein WAM60_18490 [Candidatus Promineifilaceae bacterium]
MSKKMSERKPKNHTGKQWAMEEWEELLELGQLLHASDPAAKSAVAILEEIREEESQLATEL